MLIRRRVVVIIILLASFFCVFVAGMYLTVPQANTDLGKFDVVIVLGTPANSDGTPSPEQRERVLEGVREYRGGIAPHLIMTGGAAHNGWVEADVMDRLAESKGVAPAAIIEERQALNTIQNAYYSVKIMQERGWRSAEVVSSRSHLPRASLIFSHFPIKWKMHSSSWPAGYTFRPAVIYTLEALYTTRLRVLGFRSTPYLPAGNDTRILLKTLRP